MFLLFVEDLCLLRIQFGEALRGAELKLSAMEQVHGRACIEMDRYECVLRDIATRLLRVAKKSKSRGTYLRSTSQTKVWVTTMAS